MASDTAAAAAAASSGDAARVISLDEMRKHTTEESCWIAVRGEVFDVTPFIDEHPGGFDINISNTGKRKREEEREVESINRTRNHRIEFFFNDDVFVPALRVFRVPLLAFHL